MAKVDASRGFVVLTGANCGIGLAMATKLARDGHLLLLACRTLAKAEKAAAQVRACNIPAEQIRTAQVDLSRLSSVRSLAAKLDEDEIPVRCVVQNAGVATASYGLTEDGFEETWQVNVLAPWLLSRLLLPRLKAYGKQNKKEKGRIIYVGSRLEKRGVAVDALAGGTPREKFGTFSAYSTSKLAATSVFLAEAERNRENVDIKLCTPGMVNTSLSRFAPLWLQYASYPLRALLLQTPEQGADTPSYLVTADSNELQASYYGRRQPIEASKQAQDPSFAEEILRLLEKQAAV